jgi:hypothetical protein
MISQESSPIVQGDRPIPQRTAISMPRSTSRRLGQWERIPGISSICRWQGQRRPRRNPGTCLQLRCSICPFHSPGREFWTPGEERNLPAPMRRGRTGPSRHIPQTVHGGTGRGWIDHSAVLFMIRVFLGYPVRIEVSH